MILYMLIWNVKLFWPAFGMRSSQMLVKIYNIKVSMISVFLHGCSDPVRDSSRKWKTLPNQDFNLGPSYYQVLALLSELTCPILWFWLSSIPCCKQMFRPSKKCKSQKKMIFCKSRSCILISCLCQWRYFFVIFKIAKNIVNFNKNII